ncbi:MAG TPA: bacteriohopanetetrol glucosamine biosynthesis glycosyltransferase HpnI [Hyphomicrobium sp.]|jgi:ceramide glucosyltransferase
MHLPIVVLNPFVIAGIVLGLAALAYLVLALYFTWRFREGPASVEEGWRPPVSVLKPVHGAQPFLYDCLRTFCDQDWPEYEVIFGAHSENDPAVAVVKRLIAEFPDRNLRLVVDASFAGPNPRASNLANIYKAARYDILIVADADLRVDRNCIASLAAPFVDPKVGAVASIYKGLPYGGAAAADFGALNISDWFAPSVLVDVGLRGIDFVFAMCGVRRQALDTFGGFNHLANFFPDDFALGNLTAQNGYEVVLSSYCCDTIVAEKSFAELFRHEILWQRMERFCRPTDHLMSVITWPLPSLLCLLLPWPSVVGLSIIGAEIVLRIALHYQVRRSFRMNTLPQPWLIPIRECVCFFAWAFGLFGNKVKWGKNIFTYEAFRKLIADGRKIGSAGHERVAATLGGK